MRYFTRKELKTLTPAVEYFDTVINHQFKRRSPRSTDDLVLKLYLSVSDKKVSTNLSCN